MTKTEYKEDYISFETAELLKEKGFDELTELSYELSTGCSKKIPCRNTLDTEYVSKITLQMAMKWLREVHYYNIEIDTLGMMELNTLSWRSAVYYLVNENECYCKDGFDSYEQAAEAAIKYCLENLI